MNMTYGGQREGTATELDYDGMFTMRVQLNGIHLTDVPKCYVGFPRTLQTDLYSNAIILPYKVKTVCCWVYSALTRAFTEGKKI